MHFTQNAYGAMAEQNVKHAAQERVYKDPKDRATRLDLFNLSDFHGGDAILLERTARILPDYRLVAIFFIRRTFLLANRPQDESPLEVASP